MKTSEFNYNLPPELIASHLSRPRDAARMLLMDKTTGGLSDKNFFNLPEILVSGDVLVLNDSKVIPARLSGAIGARVFEVLLVKKLGGFTWEGWVKPGRKAKIGDTFVFSKKLSAKLIRRQDDIFILNFNLSDAEFFKEITKIGEMPIPPYILKARHETHDEIVDQDDYQTIFAKNEGSVAAPTAGLHFTEELLANLRKKGIQIEYVTLHVGLGTFQPVTAENVEDFQIHSEYYEINSDTAERLQKAKVERRRIIAVGTTSVRVLESSKLVAGSGETNIYIYPGYKFGFVDGIITNFHLPKSSLLILVSAFASKENILTAYNHAIEQGYKFYSYGDGMVIIR